MSCATRIFGTFIVSGSLLGMMLMAQKLTFHQLRFYTFPLPRPNSVTDLEGGIYVIYFKILGSATDHTDPTQECYASASPASHPLSLVFPLCFFGRQWHLLD
jgi:hypothetical protein